ncbi:hypothetical protein RJ640_015893 [Escallonia rubra]|uniref:Germin-like protein n=1 Tax=Escallonia rubra TaxID=112253 RepID=A0AA88U3H8_9ASTE|nr:hypothetical protein RJ640_015893 [Escallonia rubra]
MAARSSRKRSPIAIVEGLEPLMCTNRQMPSYLPSLLDQLQVKESKKQEELVQEVGASMLHFTSPARLNGLACKNPMNVQADDFFFSGLNIMGNTSKSCWLRGHPCHSSPTSRTQHSWHLNGSHRLCIMGPQPTSHSPPSHRDPHSSRRLSPSRVCHFKPRKPSHQQGPTQKGDVFVFPVGLVHFQRNVGHGNAVAIAALSSQNPGVINIANAVFGSNPPIAADLLAKAFQVQTSLVDQLQSKF